MHCFVLDRYMGGGNAARAKAPPIADFRKQTGRHQAKLGKTERSETHSRAIARKQEFFPIKKLLLTL